MQLTMNSALAANYTSRSQAARVVTEDWCEHNVYCPACDADRLVGSPRNTRAVDFNCAQCEMGFQLKSSLKWSEDRIVDAGFHAMIQAIRGDRTPNLFVLHYTTDWQVRNLMLVPSFFFTERAIERRKPLSATARRAGWVGCNIRLSAIAPEGKIRIVRDGQPHNPNAIRQHYERIRPLSTIPVALRGWTLTVLRFIHRLGTPRFSLSDVYSFEAELARLYPSNRNVRPKIRQQLQVLRDLGLIQFLGRGKYALRS